jgi:hypothetical protein
LRGQQLGFQQKTLYRFGFGFLRLLFRLASFCQRLLQLVVVQNRQRIRHFTVQK